MRVRNISCPPYAAVPDPVAMYDTGTLNLCVSGPPRDFHSAAEFTLSTEGRGEEGSRSGWGGGR